MCECCLYSGVRYIIIGQQNDISGIRLIMLVGLPVRGHQRGLTSVRNLATQLIKSADQVNSESVLQNVKKYVFKPKKPNLHYTVYM